MGSGNLFYIRRFALCGDDSDHRADCHGFTFPDNDSIQDPAGDCLGRVGNFFRFDFEKRVPLLNGFAFMLQPLGYLSFRHRHAPLGHVYLDCHLNDSLYPWLLIIPWKLSHHVFHI